MSHAPRQPVTGNRSRGDRNNVLRIDSSAGGEQSVSRRLGDEVIGRLAERHPGLEVVTRDLAAGMEHIDAQWVGASFTPEAERSPEQNSKLAVSDQALAELQWADTLVVTAPVYNFSVPSVLKAWVDHICRAGVSFRYTKDGPRGLLRNRPVYLLMASGGIPFGSPVDFASAYLKQVFRFVGIEDVRLVGAEGVASDADRAMRQALSTLDQWLPASVGRVA